MFFLAPVFYFISYLIFLINDQVYPLYKWLSIALFIFVGFLFILVWILGEYVGRIYDESKGRPIYIEDKCPKRTEEESLRN